MNIGSKKIFEGIEECTAKDYVQDGLIAMWDGIENVGYGKHDPNATVWKDLVGKNDIKILSTAFGHFDKDHYMTLPPDSSYPAIGHAGKFISFIHAESVFSAIPDSVEGFTSFNQAKAESGGVQNNIIYHTALIGEGLGFSKTNTGIHIGFKDPSLATGQIFHLSTAFNTSNSSVIVAYKNALSVQPEAYEEHAYHNAGGYFTLGGRKQSTGWHGSNKGRLYNVRLYSRALSYEEVAKNYNIDKVRFGTWTQEAVRS